MTTSPPVIATSVIVVVPINGTETCLIGSPASQIVRMSVCSLSTLLNCVVLAAVFRSLTQAKGFSLLVAIDVLMNLFLSVRSCLAYLAETIMHSNHSSHPHCVYLKWLTTAWKISYMLRSWWMVAMTSARYTVVVKPLAASIEFSYRQQAGLLCALAAFSTAITVAMDIINVKINSFHVYDVTIAVEVVLSTGVPIVIVMVLTCIMSKNLIRRRRLWTDLPANVDSNLKATKTLLLVSGSFFILSFPHLLYELSFTILQFLNFNASSMPVWLDLLGEIKSLLISIDSGLNFAIYFVMCRNFRIQLLGFLHIHMKCLQPKVNNRKVSCGLRCQSEHQTPTLAQCMSVSSEACLSHSLISQPRPATEEASSGFDVTAISTPLTTAASVSPVPHQRQFEAGYV